MNSILSALGLFISVLMGMPARARAATDMKKTRLGGELAKLTIKLADILRRAQAILDAIAQLPKTAHPEEKVILEKDLLAMASAQIEDLREVGKHFQHEFLWGFEYSDIEEMGSLQLLHETTDVYRVLSVYRPDLGSSLDQILEFKTNLLEGLAMQILHGLKGAESGWIVIRDIRKIDHRLLAGQRSKLFFKETLEKGEEQGLVEYDDIDLNNEKSVAAYVEGAKQRLSDLDTARLDLAELIREHFDPHEIT